MECRAFGTFEPKFDVSPTPDIKTAIPIERPDDGSWTAINLNNLPATLTLKGIESHVQELWTPLIIQISSLMKLLANSLMKQLAIPLSNQKTVAK